MNKKILAIAVGATFAAPVFAQSSAVEIYGRLYPQLAISKSSGATDPAGNHDNRWSIDTSNSRFGFRGREMLGGGLSTIWQIETRVRFDTGSNNFWAGGRNSFLGLTGGFGTVKLGNMDTIYKEYGAVVGNFFGVSSGNFVSSSAVLSAHGIGLEGGSGFDDSGFHIRAPNSIQYETPEFGGFQAGIQFMPDERKGNPGRDFNSNLWSMGVKYEAGPLYASIQHERHNDWLDAGASAAAAGLVPGLNTSSKDKATRLSAGYRITPNHRITGDLAFMEWNESGSPVPDGESFERTSWAIGWEARWGGPWRTEITYVKTDDADCTFSGGITCNADGTGGSMLNLGAAYSLSKRTLIFVLYSKLKNDEFAQFSNTNTFDPNLGADTTSFAVGVSHSF